jgi:ribonuclease E
MEAEAGAIEAEARPAGDEPREGGRRRRGRGGRDRREAPAEEGMVAELSFEPVAADLPPPAAAPAVVAPAAPVAPPKVERFVLPTDDLLSVAQGAGLEWVNSDAEKIRAAQEAIANEPQPIHVPRERKPLPVVDEGPLVLVETRKDLTQFKLPFEEGMRPSA